MKKILIFILISIWVMSCSDSILDTPGMKIVGVYINDDRIDYSDQLESLPLLTVGDEVDILFILDGNGDDLKTFVAQSDDSKVKTSMFFRIDEVSDEFSDLSHGILGFVDNVTQTGLTVKATVNGIFDKKVKLSFYLFSKSPGSEGAFIEVMLSTGTEES